jgi:phenylacetate-CoA ligase
MRSSKNLKQTLFENSPPFLQRGLINLEAIRRDRFRRYGDYDSELGFYNPVWYATEPVLQMGYQLQRLQDLLHCARTHVPYYRGTLPNITLNSLADLRHIPILEKKSMREAPLSFIDERLSKNEVSLWSTSGSTGTPLRYYHDRTITRAHQAVADSLLAYFGCNPGARRIRFSGVMVAPFEKTSPPYWAYIDWYRQLQCSAFHLSTKTCKDYLDALKHAEVTFGTGYATSWHMLASYINELGETVPPLKAIVTDSEGITPEQQAFVEQAFSCPVYQTYGTGEVGQVVMQCGKKRYHVLTRACIAEVLDDNDQPVLPGHTGRIVITDLTGLHTPFIRYSTGDLATVSEKPCDCGWNTPVWSEIVGRIDDRIRTPDGRWIGRLSHITKQGIGIRESQIVQTAADAIEIRVVAASQFDANSMDIVLDSAHRYVGAAMKVSWRLVDSLPRTRNGKLKHVVREVD